MIISSDRRLLVHNTIIIVPLSKLIEAGRGYNEGQQSTTVEADEEGRVETIAAASSSLDNEPII